MAKKDQIPKFSRQGLVDPNGKNVSKKRLDYQKNTVDNNTVIQAQGELDLSALRKRDILYVGAGPSTSKNLHSLKRIADSNQFVMMCSASIFSYLLKNHIHPAFVWLTDPYAPKFEDWHGTKKSVLITIPGGASDWVNNWKGGIRNLPIIPDFVGASSVTYACAYLDFYAARSISVVGNECFWYKGEARYSDDSLLSGIDKDEYIIELNDTAVTTKDYYNAATYITKEFGVESGRELLYIDLSDSIIQNVNALDMEEFTEMNLGMKIDPEL